MIGTLAAKFISAISSNVIVVKTKHNLMMNKNKIQTHRKLIKKARNFEAIIFHLAFFIFSWPAFSIADRSVLRN